MGWHGGAYVSQALGKTGNAAVNPHLPASSILAASQLHKGWGWCERVVRVRMDHQQLDLIWIN